MNNENLLPAESVRIAHRRIDRVTLEVYRTPDDRIIGFAAIKKGLTQADLDARGVNRQLNEMAQAATGRDIEHLRTREVA